MRKLIFALGLAVLASPFAAAQEAVAAAAGGPVLTMEQAIALAIQNNLTMKLARAGTEEARGRTLQAAASMLPQLTGTMSQSRVFKANLAAQGFSSFPIAGFNPIIGPYNTFDARFRLVQPLLDFNAIWLIEAGKADKRMAQWQEQLAREQVATAAALAYLEAQRTTCAVTAAQADLQLSQSLSKLAHDQHRAGVSTGVDVARADTDTAQENLRLIRAQVAAQEADLRLKRTVGLPLDQATTLQDLPRADTETVAFPALEKMLAEASKDRAELKVTQEGVKLATYDLRSASSEHLPTITANADYGFSGNVPAGSARTGSIGGNLNLPIFAGGRAHGEVVSARARKQEADDRYSDTLTQVQEDVRLALQTLTAEIQEAHTAEQAVALAQTELKMARDRFGAGVGDNIQVVTAQTSLARALDDQVNALARYGQARVNLASALGHAQQFK